MVNSIIALSHNLKLTVVAEGIEETCQRDHLRRSGCNTGQGYLYSRPLTSDDATRLLPRATQPPARSSPERVAPNH